MPNSYELKQEAKRERILARADRMRAQGEARLNSGRQRLDAIPFGQPILIGHHSEKRDRNYRRRACEAMEKGWALQKAAAEAERRAEAIGSGGVSSDDPDGIAKLTEQLNERKAKQEAMKARNKAWQKAGNKAGRQPDGQWIEPPCAPYQLSNNSASIRRIEDRIEQLKRNETRETREEEYAGGIRLVENAEANRLQLFFPGKPSAEIRSKLKHNGYRWSPSEGAWQRHLTSSAVYWAKELLKEIAQ